MNAQQPQRRVQQAVVVGRHVDITAAGFMAGAGEVGAAQVASGGAPRNRSSCAAVKGSPSRLDATRHDKTGLGQCSEQRSCGGSTAAHGRRPDPDRRASGGIPRGPPTLFHLGRGMRHNVSARLRGLAVHGILRGNFITPCLYQH